MRNQHLARRDFFRSLPFPVLIHLETLPSAFISTRQRMAIRVPGLGRSGRQTGAGFG